MQQDTNPAQFLLTVFEKVIPASPISFLVFTKGICTMKDSKMLIMQLDYLATIHKVKCMEEITTTENDNNNKTTFIENLLTIPPIDTSRSSVRIKTIFGLAFILASARLLQCEMTQMRIKCNITNGDETIFDAELKTNKAMT